MEKSGFCQKSVGNSKGILLIALIVCVLAILSVGTLAFFTETETAYNVITTGTIDVTLKETTIDEEGKEIPFPQSGIENVMPGAQVAKRVWVENSGTESMYVRVKVETKVVPSELDPKYILLGGLNTKDWTLDGDYYYYNQAVNVGEKTSLLFEEVVFDKNMPNEYKRCEVDVIVNAQAVQSKNNGDNVFASKGWPSEN